MKMALNFNQGSVFNLKPIALSEVKSEVRGCLIGGEEIVAAFKTVRDQLVFTNKRIISVDVQGITGARTSYVTMPYSKVQFFSIQTPGFVELVPDSELEITFASGETAKFEFKGNTDIGMIGRMIAEYVL